MELAYVCRPTQHRVLRRGSAFASHLKSSLEKLSEKSRRCLQRVAPRTAEKVLFGLFCPPYSGPTRARSVARIPFGQFQKGCSRKFAHPEAREPAACNRANVSTTGLAWAAAGGDRPCPQEV